MRILFAAALICTPLLAYAVPDNRTPEERLTEECARGLKSSCAALKKIKDSKKDTTEVRCVTVGAVTKCKQK